MEKQDEDANMYKVLKILNNSENPIKERGTWWNDNTLCMRNAQSGLIIEAKDDDKNETWRSTFWTKWNAVFDQWHHVVRDA